MDPSHKLFRSLAKSSSKEVERIERERARERGFRNTKQAHLLSHFYTPAPLTSCNFDTCCFSLTHSHSLELSHSYANFRWPCASARPVRILGFLFILFLVWFSNVVVWEIPTQQQAILKIRQWFNFALIILQRLDGTKPYIRL